MDCYIIRTVMITIFSHTSFFFVLSYLIFSFQQHILSPFSTGAIPNRYYSLLPFKTNLPLYILQIASVLTSVKKIKDISYEIYYLLSSKIYLFLLPAFSPSLLSQKYLRRR